MTAALPRWVECIADRLQFITRKHPRRKEIARDLTALVAAVSRRIASPQEDGRLLQDFLRACLDEFAAAVHGRPELAEARGELGTLCDLARRALEAGHDDRPVIQAQWSMDLAGFAGAAAYVPGRVVFLAAMVAEVPDEECAAATMLVNDLAAVDIDLVLRALRAAVRS